MTQHANSSASSKAILRRRAAVMAVGMGVSVVLGAGVALAAEPQAGAFTYVAGEPLAATVTAQAEGQKQAADAKAAANLEKTAAINKSPAAWVKPLNKYTIGSTFGLGGTMWSNKHSGQDFVAPTGTSVKAANRGTVVEAYWVGHTGTTS